MKKCIGTIVIVLSIVALSGCCAFNSGCGGEVSSNTCCGSSGW